MLNSLLTNRFLNNVKYEPYNEFNDEKLTVAQIENMSLEERKSTIRQIYFKQQDKNSESSYRKQTCAYIHKDVIKLIDSIDNVNGEDIYSFLRYYSSKNATLIGINYYLLKFNIYYKEDKFYEKAWSITEAANKGDESAIKLFESIPGWKDADERAVECRRKLELQKTNQ